MDGSTLKASLILFAWLLIASPARAQQQDSSDSASAEKVARESAPVVQSTSHAEVAPVRAPTPVAGNWWSDIDSDADGKISAIEAKAYAGLEMRFVAIDADHDGFVKLEEYRTFFESTVGQTP